MTYTVRIWNTDSCSVVRPIAIRVSGREKLGAYSLPTECGASTGSLVVNAVPQEAANWFAVTPNNDTLTAADAVGNTLSDLSSGVYRLFYSDNVGCISRDTLVEIGTNNSTVADFSVQPTTGAAPLEIDIENLSQNATASEWYLNENYVGTSPPALLDTAGGFEITLVAWQNDLTCTDTVTKTVLVYDSLMVTIPNVFTPNNDGLNDFFTIGVNLPVKVDLTIVNRWGNTVFTHQEAISKGQHELWNGSLSSGEQVNDGVYFYTLRFTLEGQAQETVTKTGFVQVFGE
jgi:gliding motility-associated-like protein